MMQRIRKIRAVDAGFTLIELLVVVIILGVLAGIVVFAITNFTDHGVNAACKSDVKNEEIASEAYFAKFGAYPAAESDLLTQHYLRELPNSPNYTVTYTPNGANTPPTITGSAC